MAAAAIGVDLGGTALRAAIVAADGAVLAHAEEATRAADGPAAIVGQIAALVGRVRAARPDVPVAGLGVGSPGPLDAAAGVVHHAPTLAGWRDVPLRDLLAARPGLEVRLENDANVATLAEWRFGAGRGLADVVYVTVSTGIGGGVVADGRLLSGRRGLAAEVGHMAITDRPVPCGCGGTGCWEALASGPSLARLAAAAAAAEPASSLARLLTERPLTARDVATAATAGDALARRLMRDEARWLGIGFANLLHLYSPAVIVVGGGLASAWETMRPEIERTVRTRAMPAYRDVPVAPSALGPRAGVVGAASLLLAGRR